MQATHVHTYRSIAARRTAVRRAAGNAGSATLSAYVVAAYKHQLVCADSVDRVRVTVTAGESVQLSCRKSSDRSEESIVAQWKYRKSHGQSAFRLSLNRNVMQRFRRRFSVREASNDSSEEQVDFSLVISPVLRTDVGLYMCLITGQSDELLRFIHLDVTGQ